ncbi:MAG TPA: metallophosphoesterase [Steroidobacteraceae bacterium]|nr:metallophosphoesterase [Steroidobacteraceae bacterium]
MPNQTVAAQPTPSPLRGPAAMRRRRPSRFIRNIVTLVAILHVYVGLRLLPALPIGLAGRVLGALALCASFALIIVGARARMMQGSGLAANLAWLGSLNGGFFSSLAVLTVTRDLFLGPAVLFASRGEAATLETASAIAVPLLAVLATVVGFIDARRRPRVVDVEVPLPGLPRALQGFTIAQISDVHMGPTIKRDFLRGIVETVNSLEVDLVAVTGDLVDGSVEQLAVHVEPLACLRARHGSYFVTGNHEYYSGAPSWIAELRRLGLRVLLNEHVVLTHDGASLLIAGVTDYSASRFDPAQRSDPEAAIAGAPPELRPRVLLAHQPRTAAAAADAGFDLQLSGHTHGGQFWPWNLFVRLQQPFTAGLHRLGNLWVYTSRGSGYWGPPKRLGVPSEVARIRLVAARPS